MKGKIVENIEYKLNRLPNGFVFTYANFLQDVDEKEAIIKALNRMVKARKIAKPSRGKYCQPQILTFGNILNDKQVAEAIKQIFELSTPLNFLSQLVISHSFLYSTPFGQSWAMICTIRFIFLPSLTILYIY